MACPFFHPGANFVDGAWLSPPRLPLGDPCFGECKADGAESIQPSLDELRNYCNAGYARGRCSRFPSRTDAADAVRFSVSGDHEGGVSLVYVYERDYGPVRHGMLVYDISAGSFNDAPESTVLEAQARVFVTGYLARRLAPKATGAE